MRPAFRNVAYNLAGQILPMAFALVSLPMLAHHAGTERLGFLGLAWSLIGYFALLDLGLSRIVTRRVALAGLEGTLVAENRVVRRLCVQLFALSAVVSLALTLVVKARWVVGASATPSLLAEAEAALPVLLLTIPATVVTGLLRGALEGLQRFAKANLLRSMSGALSFAAPLLVLPFRNDLLALTAAIAVGRVLTLIAHARWALGALDADARRQALERPRIGAESPARVRDMIREGGWLTVSNVVGPLMVTFDRFAVAAIVSLTAASYYFVPQEIALRFLVIPGAVAATIFPMLARLRGAGDDRHRISRDAFLAISTISLPACALLAAFAHPLLGLWMGPQFASIAGPVAAIIAVGLFANCCAQAPFAWIQAAGRSDVTGRLHLIELPFYALILVILTWQWGVVGAALAWSVRALVDFALLFRASSRLFPAVALRSVLVPTGLGIVALAVLAAGAQLAGGAARIGLLVAMLVACAGLALAMAARLLGNVRRLKSMRTVAQPACPNCDAGGSVAYADLRDKVYGAPGSWSMRHCVNASCGVYWLDPAPHRDDLGIAYEHYHTHAPDPDTADPGSFLSRVRDAYVARKLRLPGDRAWMPRLASRLFPLLQDRSQSALYAHFYLSPRVGGRLLEVGCGAGRQLDRMVRDGWNASGVDFDAEAVAVARARGLDVRVGDVRELDFADESFDAIVMAQVIEHVFDPVGLLTRCARLLKPGGTLISITPNADSLGHRLFRRDWRGLEPPRHLVVYTSRALRLACRRAGLAVQRVDVTARDAANLLLASQRIRRAPADGAIERPLADRPPPRSLRLVGALEILAGWCGLSWGEELVLTARK